MLLNSFLEKTYPFSVPLRCTFSMLYSLGPESPVFEIQTFKKITLASQRRKKKFKEALWKQTATISRIPYQSLVHSLHKDIYQGQMEILSLLHKYW